MDIINKIKLGQFVPGGRIQTEEELCNFYNCSRLTVRNALTAIANEGYIKKIQGKGTFVNSVIPQKSTMKNINSCSALIRSQNMKPSKKIIFCGLSTEIDSTIKNKLQIEKDNPVFVYIRVYYANEIPAIYCCSYYNAKKLPGIETIDFSNKSIVSFLKERYNIELKRSDRELSAKLANTETASLLCTPKNYPLLQVTDLKTCVLQGIEVPIELYTFQYVTDRIKYYPEIQ
ncbi:GntR family transcriptional regulator [Treponema parvum]|uniref:GntR family transcriptional regulator n=1 Tax=Treponema parvum TaxID=138851 RepID=A0A975F217_9SPIR|nr:GntR family transcriptional regulator [Treponema parvum]QTQ12981.1 GntR family transcriptional regulator [Treponema parvum]